MLDKFTKSLGFLGIDASNMNHQSCEKYMYKFEDATINKHWLCFYAFYKDGYNSAMNEVGAFAIREIKK